MNKFLSMFSASVLLFLFAVQAVDAQTWHTGRQHTIEWGAVTETAEGVAIPASELTYEVFVSYPTAIDHTGKWDPTLVSPEVSDLEYTILLPRGGRVFAGVRAVRRYIPEGEEDEVIARSAIAWSDEAEYVLGDVTFGLFWLLQSTVTGGAWTSGVRLQ